MKLRTDLLAKLRPEDVIESVEAHNHRYKAEPLFSKTGTGSLSSASTSERANEVKHNTDFIRKLTKRAEKSGKPLDPTCHELSSNSPSKTPARPISAPGFCYPCA